MSNPVYGRRTEQERTNLRINRIAGRIERYAENVEYYQKWPDSAAMQLNLSLLETDKRAYQQLTGRCYQLSK